MRRPYRIKAVKIRIAKYRFTFHRDMKTGTSVSRDLLFAWLHGHRQYLSPNEDDPGQRHCQQKIRPFILVISNQYTLFEGSFYSNSSLTGNWSDFAAKELVEYMDKNFKTMATVTAVVSPDIQWADMAPSKSACLFPDVFSSVYALSPGLLAFVKEFGPNSDSFKELGKIKTHEELKKTYYPRVLVAVARAWSPNPSNPPFYCDLPFTYQGDSLIVNNAVMEKWNQNMPVYMVDKYASNLRKLKAIKLDWGRNDAQPFSCSMWNVQSAIGESRHCSFCGRIHW